MTSSLMTTMPSSLLNIVGGSFGLIKMEIPPTYYRDGAKEKRKEPEEEVGGEEDVRASRVKASKAAKTQETLQ
uniref:Uncharacterized protein n=1 Tax=Brassica oleracea TaxID=3712 RepID=A0A3P6H263_BRAOL|nr:unnamed protein product [Brassica oleracea]